MCRHDGAKSILQAADEAREGAPRDVAESLISSRLQATHLDGEHGEDAALDAGLSEEAAAALRQRVDERLRQAAEGARRIIVERASDLATTRNRSNFTLMYAR